MLLPSIATRKGLGRGHAAPCRRGFTPRSGVRAPTRSR